MSDWVIDGIYRAVFPTGSQSATDQHVDEQTEQSTSGLVSLILQDDVAAVRAYLDTPDGQREARTRGAVGECILHLCYLFEKPNAAVIAHEVLERFPGMAALQYDDSKRLTTIPEWQLLRDPRDIDGSDECRTATGQYDGENSAHICIVHGELDTLKDLLERCPSLVSQRARGTFFQRSQSTNDSKGCYFGEYLLSFAVCANQPDMVRYLTLDAPLPANLYAKDSYGNTCFHMAVIYDNAAMYSLLLSVWEGLLGKAYKEQETARHLALESGEAPGAVGPRAIIHPENLQNGDGLTPLTLAAYHGHKAIFDHILEQNKTEQWQYGPVTCDIYPLEQLDGSRLVSLRSPHNPDGPRVPTLISSMEYRELRRCGELLPEHADMLSDLEVDAFPRSVVDILLEREHLELLKTSIMDKLLTRKWDQFAHPIFMSRFMRYMLLLVFVAFVLSTRLRSGFHGGPWLVPTLGALFDHGSCRLFPDASWATAPAVFPASGSSEPRCFEVDHWAGTGLLMTVQAIAEVVVTWAALSKLRVELRELRRTGLRRYALTGGAMSTENGLAMTATVSMLLGNALLSLASPMPESMAPNSAVFRLFPWVWAGPGRSALPGAWPGLAEVGMILFAASVLLTWLYFLWFLLGVKHSGPLVIMIAAMVQQDVTRFSLIAAPILMGFMQAFLVLHGSSMDADFIRYIGIFLRAMLGEMSTGDDADAEGAGSQDLWIPGAQEIIMLVYTMLVTILLLNLLVAMLTDTYERIREESEDRWRMERARIIQSIESDHGLRMHANGKTKYWMNVHGRPWLRVEDFNEGHYASATDDVAFAAAHAAVAASARAHPVGALMRRVRSSASASGGRGEYERRIMVALTEETAGEAAEKADETSEAQEEAEAAPAPRRHSTRSSARRRAARTAATDSEDEADSTAGAATAAASPPSTRSRRRQRRRR